MSFSAGDQYSIFPERIIFQAQKLKGAREAVREKLEEYREQYEQMEVRAVAAEMEVTSLKLDVGELTQKVSQYKDTNRLLTDQLSAQQRMCEDSEKNLQRFQRKLSRIRTALTTEVNKLRQSEKDLRLAFDSIMRCVLEFRSDAISKEDFLCAVDLIFSATVQHRKTSCYSSGRIHTLFGDHERQRLASLSHTQRKSRLAQLMSMLDEKELGTTTDEECLSQGEITSPPPIPPRSASQTQLMRQDEHLNAPPLPMPLSPRSRLHSQRRKNAVASRASGVGIYSLAIHADSDSNSSDNFEHFTPPARPRKRYRSEPQFHLSPHVDYRRGSSPLPSVGQGPGYIKNSSAVLTRKPSWLVEKHMKKMRKSKSVGDVVHFNVTRSLCADSDDNTGGTMDSGGYARPFEHLKSWRKLLGMDGSILTGSLPRIDKAVELEDSDVSGCTYLDPSELAAVVFQTESKLGRRVSQRLRKRMDTVFQSAIYLPLLNVAPEGRGEHSPDKTFDENSPSTFQYSPVTPYIRMETAIEEMKRETGRSFTFPERCHSSHSCYTSDGSSCEGQLDNAYAEIPLANGIDNAVYDIYTSQHPKPVTDDTYAAIDDFTELSITKSRRSESQPTITEKPSSLIKPRHYTDPAMRLEDGYCALEDTLDGSSISLGPAARPPTPPPRTARRIFPLESTLTSGGQLDSTKLQVPGIGPLPLYTTLRGSHQHIQLVPLSNYSPNASSDEHGLSDNEHPEHLYSLGKFVAVTPHRRGLLPSPGSGSPTPQRRGTQSATTADPKWIPPSVRQDSRDALSSPDVKRKNGRSHPPVKTKRSHTFQATSSSQIEQQGNILPEKSGYLNKMDPKQKHWSRRWFVLRGSELKYYRTKDAFFGQKRPKGVINLDSWCKLSLGESLAAFELATPNKTYHLVATSNKECEEWLRVLEAAMRLQSPAENAPTLKPKLPTVSGWAQVSKNGRSQRVWCTLVGNSLDLSSKPGEKPLHSISMHRSTIHKKRDSLLMDAKDSRSHLHSVLLTVTEDDNEVTCISPDNLEDKESWFYHLSAASTPGEQGPELTNTERILSQIMQEGVDKDHPQWQHPVLNYTLAPLKNTLTSLPSAALSATAKRLFHSVQLFMGTSIKLPGLDYHICSMQHIISTCLLHPPLQDELYCQLLRQLGHTSPPPISSNILQGWYLLFFLIQTFLPQKEKFMWYLTKFLERHTSSQCSVVANYAQQCARLVDRMLESGPRECRPSQMELQVFLSHCAHSPHTLSAVLRTHVYLSDGSTQEVEFTPTTTVQEFLSQLSQKVDMPYPTTTGFALVSDWPGVEEDACYYLFPESKLCDVISMWTDSLEQLNHIRMHHQQRTISLSYRNRLSFKKHRGFETEREAVLLTYQISEDVFSGRHLMAKVDEGIGMAAIMAQIEYGDWSSVQGGELVAREALQRFCPRKFTHLALEHDQTLLQRKLIEQWKELSGKTRQECAHMYLHAAQQWRFCGATLFLAEKKYSSQKTHAIWLTVDEEGTSLLERSTMECLASYSYSEVSTFGSHGDDFMLVVSPHHNSYDTSGNLVEKLLLAMPKVKIREATFLIASYLESYEGPRPNT